MRVKFNIFFTGFLAVALTLFLSLNVMASNEEEQSKPAGLEEKIKSRTHAVPDFFVPPPPFSEDIFPCSECHDELEPDETRRELAFHDEIVLRHAEEQRWCLDCHNPNNRDKLRLASGQLILFEKSYLLCGQCHGTIFRDWKAGVHGKRTGYWNGKKQYRLCVHCHNPHDPKFKPLHPLPPPIRPEDLKYTKSSDDEIPENPLEKLLEAENKDAK